MIKAGDALLIELARKAGVRPPHLFHLQHFRAQLKDAFSIEGYATFAMIEARHVERMVEVLDAIAKPERKTRGPSPKTRLPADWTMPEEWLLIGRDKRFWTMDVCRTEAEKFVNWHRMKGNAFADWKSAWRNWIDGSNREDGVRTDELTPERRAENLSRKIALYRRMGRHEEADALERN